MHRRDMVGVIGEVKNFSYFEWSIPNFFSMTSIQNVYYLSPKFSSLGGTWYFRMYPAGFFDKGFVSLYLYREGETNIPSDNNLTFIFGLKKSKCVLFKCKAEFPDRKKERVPSSIVGGFNWFLELAELRKRKFELAPLDTLTITCHVEEIVPPSTEEEPNSRGLLELELLSSDLSHLYASKTGCDTTVKVLGKEIRVHRAILMARSPVFQAMFTHDTKEAREGVVEVSDCDPDSFEDFLRYLYEGKLESVTFKAAHDLYIAAEKYDVQKLKEFCVVHLLQGLTPENVCYAASLGQCYADAELQFAASKFFNHNFTRVFRTTEWKRLLRTNCHLVEQMLEQMGSAVEDRLMPPVGEDPPISSSVESQSVTAGYRMLPRSAAVEAAFNRVENSSSRLKLLLSRRY